MPSPADSHRTRLDRFGAVASSLALLSDRRLRDILEEAPVLGSGIGGTSMFLHVEGTPVFVKRVPLRQSCSISTPTSTTS
jgi:hypothetical protein